MNAPKGGTGIEAWLPFDAFPPNAPGATMKSLAGNPGVARAADEECADQTRSIALALD